MGYYQEGEQDGVYFYQSWAIFTLFAYLQLHVCIHIADVRMAWTKKKQTTTTAGGGGGGSGESSEQAEAEEAEGYGAIRNHALLAIFVGLIFVAAAAVGIALNTQNMDDRMSKILTGLSRLLSAVTIFLLSVKVPKWMGVYYCVKEDHWYNSNCKQRHWDPVLLSGTLRALKFNVKWGVWRQFGAVYVLLFPFYCGAHAGTVPVSAASGILAGFAVSFGIYFGRTRFAVYKTLIALCMAALLSGLSAVTFGFGCYYVQAVWGHKDPNFAVIVASAFFLWSLCAGGVHWVYWKHSKLKFAARLSREKAGHALNSYRFNTQLFHPRLFQPHQLLLHPREKRMPSILERITSEDGSRLAAIVENSRESFLSSEMSMEELQRSSSNMQLQSQQSSTAPGTAAAAVQEEGDQSCCTTKEKTEQPPEEKGGHPNTTNEWREQPPPKEGDDDQSSSTAEKSEQQPPANKDPESDHPEGSAATPCGGDGPPPTNDDEDVETMCSLIRLKCCGGHPDEEGTTRRQQHHHNQNIYERMLIFLKWSVLFVVNLLFLWIVIVNIGASAQVAAVNRNLPVTDRILYHNMDAGEVCAYDEVGGPGSTIATFANVTEAHDAGFRVLHCGACGACSTWSNLAIEWRTRTDLAERAQKCGKKLFLQGYEAAFRCHADTIGFDDACTECWVRDEMCARENCVFVFLQAQIIKNVGNFAVSPGGVVTSATCEEAMCELDFVPCSGASRRRMNVVSGIARSENQQCNVVDADWEDLFGP